MRARRGPRGPVLPAEWLGRLLTAARSESGKPLSRAAACLSVDAGTISKYEHGRLPVRPGRLVEMLDLYGISGARRDALVELGWESWRRGWWAEFARDVPSRSIDYAWLAGRATVIRSFDTMTLMGLVQTPEFATAVERAGDPDADERSIARAVRFRMGCQRVLDGERPPDVVIVLDESLLHRAIGGPEVMSAQLRHIADLMESGTIELRVLPYSTGAHGGRHGAFQIFDVPGLFPEVGYAETMIGPVFTETDGIHPFTRTYERLGEAAFGPDKSFELVTTAAEDIRPGSRAPRPLRAS